MLLHGNLLPAAHAHTLTGLSAEATVVGPRQINLVFHPEVKNVRDRLTTPTVNDHVTRTTTNYRIEGTTHILTLSGPDMSTGATASLMLRSGNVPFGNTICTFFGGCATHIHHLPYNLVMSAHDRQRPRIDTSTPPQLDMGTATLEFRATEPLVAGPGGAAPGHVRVAGIGSFSASDRISLDGTQVKIHMSAATHERFDRVIDGWPNTKTTTTMAFGHQINLRDISSPHDRVFHNHHGYSFDSGRWWLTVEVLRDETPPAIVGSPHLDLNTGRLTIRLDERVTTLYKPYITLEDRNSGTQHRLTAASLPTPFDTDTLVLTLSHGGLARLSEGYARTGGLQMDMHRGATRDASGNLMGAVANLPLSVTPDNVRPTLDGARAPHVDLLRYRTTVHFGEAMDVSRTDPGKIVVSNATGGEVRLLDGTASGRDGGTVTVSFSSATKARIADLGTPLRVGAEPNAYRDLQGNGNDRIDPVQAGYTRDTYRPGIVWGGSTLDLGTGILAVPANDVIDTGRIYPHGFVLHLADSADAHRKADVRLAGAAVNGTDRPYTGTIGLILTAPQKAAVVSASADGAPTARVGIGGWAYSDYPENNHGWYVSGIGAPVAVTADRMRPMLESDPVIDLDSGKIRMEFDEYIDASRIDASGITLAANGSVRLQGGALAPATGQADGTLVVLDMPAALENAAYSAHGTARPSPWVCPAVRSTTCRATHWPRHPASSRARHPARPRLSSRRIRASTLGRASSYSSSTATSRPLRRACWPA